jgi:lipopolysaccharide transport system permease protein
VRVRDRHLLEYTDLMNIDPGKAPPRIRMSPFQSRSSTTDGNAISSAWAFPMPEAAARDIIIEPNRRELHYWQELWHYRELFRVLAWRDVSVRYKQTVIGAAWALIRPFLTMVVFTVVFGRIAGLSSGGVPYPLLVFAGILPWSLFSTVLSDASASVVTNSNLISKVYFPRLIVPVATVVVGLIDFFISFLILIMLMIWYRYIPSWHMFLLPAFIVIALVASLGPALWIAALNVKYRDFRYIIPFIIQFGLYLSPVGFSSGVIAEQWRLVYSINPMVGVIDGFRWCILGAPQTLNVPEFLLGVGVSGVFMWYGIRKFRKTERSFADLI